MKMKISFSTLQISFITQKTLGNVFRCFFKEKKSSPSHKIKEIFFGGGRRGVKLHWKNSSKTFPELFYVKREILRVDSLHLIFLMFPSWFSSHLQILLFAKKIFSLLLIIKCEDLNLSSYHMRGSILRNYRGGKRNNL
jgi:hypothetical protein